MGLPVTALDVSPGAIDVCVQRGVNCCFTGTVMQYAQTPSAGRFNTFLLYGNNLALLGSRRDAVAFLAVLHTLAEPGARIVGQNSAAFLSDHAQDVRYRKWNRLRGRMPGQQRVRVLYGELRSAWVDRLFCTVEELSAVVAGTGWRIDDSITGSDERYLVTLRSE
jgi:hypothetical protein